MNAEPDDATAYFILTAWCTGAKAWLDLSGRYGCSDEARRTATERGIYRVT